MAAELEDRAAAQVALERESDPSAGPYGLVVDEKAPLATARSFVARLYRHPTGRTLHFWQGQFYGWTGTHYTPVSNDRLRAELYPWLTLGCEPRKRLVDEVIDALQAVCHLDGLAPQWIGEPTCSGDVIATSNGLLEVSTRTLHPPSARYFGLNAVPFCYDPQAPTPTVWLEFLDTLFREDSEALHTLQEVFGLMLSADTSHQKIVLLIGPKRAGKGTITRVLSALVGPDNTCSPTLSGLGQNFGLASLIGKPLAIISDARLSGRSDLAAVIENLLRISGEDAVSVPRKYQADWIGQLPTRFVILTNELPALMDSSGALASRFLILRLTQSFYGREDRTLTERLLAELPGIFNWALAGRDRLAGRGHLLQPASGAEMVEELDRLGSPIKAFVADECILDAAAEIPCQNLYGIWSNWCEGQHRDHPGSLQMFGRNLSAAFPAIRTKRPRSEDGRQRVYVGIRLRRPDDPWSGPRWSADHSIARVTTAGEFDDHDESAEQNMADRGPSRTSPADLLRQAASLTQVPAAEISRHIWFDPAAEHVTLDWLVDQVRQLLAAGLVTVAE